MAPRRCLGRSARYNAIVWGNATKGRAASLQFISFGAPDSKRLYRSFSEENEVRPFTCLILHMDNAVGKILAQRLQDSGRNWRTATFLARKGLEHESIDDTAQAVRVVIDQIWAFKRQGIVPVELVRMREG